MKRIWPLPYPLAKLVIFLICAKSYEVYLFFFALTVVALVFLWIVVEGLGEPVIE